MSCLHLIFNEQVFAFMGQFDVTETEMLCEKSRLIVLCIQEWFQPFMDNVYVHEQKNYATKCLCELQKCQSQLSKWMPTEYFTSLLIEITWSLYF